MSIIKNWQYCILCWHAEPLLILRKTWKPSCVLKLHNFHCNLTRITHIDLITEPQNQSCMEVRDIGGWTIDGMGDKNVTSVYLKRASKKRVKIVYVKKSCCLFFPWQHAKHNELTWRQNDVIKNVMTYYVLVVIQPSWSYDSYPSNLNCIDWNRLFQRYMQQLVVRIWHAAYKNGVVERV